MTTPLYDTDVLIIGAGPTGLTLAAALQQLNVSCRLIEQKPRLSETSKATNLMQGTQEQLASYGLIAPILPDAGKMRRIMMHGYGANLGPRTMHLPESVFPDILLYGQDRIEASLAKSLAERGGNIEFGTKLLSLQQNSTGVEASVDKAGQQQTIRAKYAVGCDGPWGATRTFTTCDFTPVKTGRSIRQVDAKLRWKRLSSMEQMWLFYFSDGFAVVVPLLDGYTRVLTIEPSGNMPDRNPTVAEMRDKLRVVANDDSIELEDPKWLSHTELTMGIAPALRDGRVLLAGDAGNPILPNGGQGLNTGIQDSLNLGWKLAAVLHDEANDTLLDTYQQERLPLRQALEKVQFNSLKYTTETSAVMRFLIRNAGNLLLNKGGEYQMAKAFSQLGVNYRKSPLTMDTVKQGKVKAGERPVNAEIVDAQTLHEVRLSEVLTKPVWKLVCFNGNDDDIAVIQTAMQALLTQSQLRFTPIIITTSAKKQTDASHLYYDIDEVAHKAYQISKPVMLLIRPDQYIAVRTQKGNWPVLETFSRRWFREPAV